MRTHILQSCRGTIALVAALLLLPATSVATTLMKVDVPMLKQESESVVHARVKSMESAWNEQRTMIFTAVTLDVIRTLHGKPAEQVTVRVPGGTVDGYTIEMAGAPKFQAGSAVVAFINQWDDGTPKVAGYYQGVSQVVLDSLGNPVLQGGAANGQSLAQLAKQMARQGGAQ
jgi:hypothetical protein